MPKPRRVIRITASLILTMFLMTTVACAPPSVPDQPGAQDVTLADQDVTVTSALQNAADYDKLYATIKEDRRRCQVDLRRLFGRHGGVQRHRRHLTLGRHHQPGSGHDRGADRRDRCAGRLAFVAASRF